MVSRQDDIDANPEGYLEPTGFVFHMSRCGSTLTANLMGSSPYNLVYSESKPPTGLMGLCDKMKCTAEQRVSDEMKWRSGVVICPRIIGVRCVWSILRLELCQACSMS